MATKTTTVADTTTAETKADITTAADTTTVATKAATTAETRADITTMEATKADMEITAAVTTTAATKADITTAPTTAPTTISVVSNSNLASRCDSLRVHNASSMNCHQSIQTRKCA